VRSALCVAMASTVNQGDWILSCTDDAGGVVVAIHRRDRKSTTRLLSLIRLYRGNRGLEKRRFGHYNFAESVGPLSLSNDPSVHDVVSAATNRDCESC